MPFIRNRYLYIYIHKNERQKTAISFSRWLAFGAIGVELFAIEISLLSSLRTCFDFREITVTVIHICYLLIIYQMPKIIRNINFGLSSLIPKSTRFTPSHTPQDIGPIALPLTSKCAEFQVTWISMKEKLAAIPLWNLLPRGLRLPIFLFWTFYLP